MFKCKIADFIIEIDNKYPYSENACRDYLYTGDEKIDLHISLSDAEIENERIPDKNPPASLMEFSGIYRKLNDFLLNNNAFVMHCSSQIFQTWVPQVCLCPSHMPPCPGRKGIIY